MLSTISFLSVSLFSLLVIFGYSSIFGLITLILVTISLSSRLFWLVTVPVLIIQSGFEKTVYFDRDLSFESLFDLNLIPDLWLVVFFVRALSFLFHQFLGKKQLAVNTRWFALLLYMSLSLTAGTLFFIVSNEPLFIINKAPIKLTLFVILSFFILSEIKSPKYVITGLVFSTIIGAFLRIVIIFGPDVKDPGIYTFLGVFISAFMISHGGLLASNLALVIPKNKYFWIFIFLLHFSVSRTEILLFAVSAYLVFFNQSSGFQRLRNLFVAFPLALLFFIGLISFAPTSINNYLFHKLSFFYSFQEGVEMGNSAAVRFYTLVNLINGTTGNILNNIFGYGFMGYINFDNYYTASIWTEGAFSQQELEAKKFFRLHFFLNNILFYFGLVGVAVYSYIFFFFYRKYKTSLALVLILYAFMNCFFRLELVVLFPIVIYAFSTITLAKVYS